ncbi:hypothetical protein JOB18_008955 [Solea senegalensis]|uniref:Uncharacterized protein n=1 Tax=Solea senegalensis TaxID=28829 RepID=A0AAV6SC66_SOLSE|nr:hypothetical protein JOB18_008955 [Solea senegalensis]
MVTSRARRGAVASYVITSGRVFYSKGVACVGLSSAAKFKQRKRRSEAAAETHRTEEISQLPVSAQSACRLQ